MSIPKIISFLNYKGGVGKTNVSVNFAYYAAAERNLKTLLIDWDPQGDSTEYIGVGRENVRFTVFDFLVNGLKPEIGANIAYTDYDNLHLIGANSTLKNVENLVASSEDTFELFRNCVHDCATQFDIVVIDCPPANSHVNIASIFASTNIFVVTTPGSDSIDKINLVNQMVSNIADVMRENADVDDPSTLALPEVKGVILTMAVENTVGLDVAREHLHNTWGDLLFPVAVPRTVAAQYSVTENTPVLKSRPKSKLSQRYREIFQEVLIRV